MPELHAALAREVVECGDGLWIPLIEFDATTDSECPDGEWVFSDGTGTSDRAGCSRASASTTTGCTLASFSVGSFQYSRVCGMITGRTFGEPDGFMQPAQNDIDNMITLVGQTGNVFLVDGVTITTSSNAHIWTFAANSKPDSTALACPCNDAIDDLNTMAVDFADGNYFCDYSRTGSAAAGQFIN